MIEGMYTLFSKQQDEKTIPRKKTLGMSNYHVREKRKGGRGSMISWMIWFQVDLTSVKTTLQVEEKGLVILKVALLF